MDYSIYKDSNVNSTVEKIKNTLKGIGIELGEYICKYPIEAEGKPSSLRVTLFNIGDIGTNGKGTNPDNARASAYSEFMERLQNQAPGFNLINQGEFLIAPDEKVSTDNPNQILKYYDKSCLEYLYKISYFNDSVIEVPFYSVKEKKLCYLPIKTILYLQGTTGMSAGNTPEEAIVQGLSEIYERYSVKKVILEKLSLPDVPEEIWSKYEKIKNLKEYIEKCGYNVYIKDASLGENLPVICTIFENKKEETFNFTFGAQPSLPIAIERTLTEFTQGGIKTFERNALEYQGEKCYSDIIYLLQSFLIDGKILKKEKNIDLYNQLLNTTPDYEFSNSAWIDEKKSYTNKDFLKFLINNVKALSDKNMYIRDVSFLDFPSYFIYIPQMTEDRFFDEHKIMCEYNFELWKYYTGDNCVEHNDINSLISALDFKINYLDHRTKDDYISPLANEYVMLLCCIAKNDLEQIIKYCDLIINSPEIQKNNNKFEVMKEYFLLLQEQKSVEELNELLNNKYTKEEITSLKMFIQHLSFDQIKQILRDCNIRKFNHQNNNINNQNNNEDDLFFEKVITNSDFGNIDYRMECVKRNLTRKYIENTPLQMDLKNVFDFIE